MGAGRPGYDRISIGHAFVKYAEENSTCVTVPHFAKTVGVSSDTMLTWCQEDPQFRRLYRIAKELIGVNRLKCTQPDAELILSDSTYRGTLHHYDYDIKNDVRDDKAYESSLRKDEASTPHTNINLTVPHDLAIGSNIPTAKVSD